MDNIDRIIHYAETYKFLEPRSENEPVAIYDAVDKLRVDNPRDYLNWYQNIKEFQRAKLMRSNTLPVEAGEDELKTVKIFIKDNGDNRDTGVSPDSEQE